MINDAFDLRISESHIEVYKFRAGAIVGATVLALMLQAKLHHFANSYPAKK